MHRLTVLAWVVLAVGLAGVAGAAGSTVAAHRADTDLRATGRTVHGTVLHVDPDQRGAPGGAEIAYRDGTIDRTAYVQLDGYADQFAEGEDVEVVYDPDDVDRMTLDDVPWTPPATDAVLGLSIISAVVGLLLGPLLLWVRSRTRHLLRTHVWSPVRVTVLRGRGRTFLADHGSEWRSYVTGRWPTPEEDDLPNAEHDAWWVTDGRRAVFSPDQGGPLVLARLERRFTPPS